MPSVAKLFLITI